MKAASEKPVHAEGDDRRSHSGKRLGFLLLFLLLAIGGVAGWQGYEQGWFGTGSDHETLIDREDPYLEEDGSDGNDQRTVSSGGPQPGSDWTVDLPSGESMELVWLDPNRFMTGSPSGEDGHNDDEDPRTEVVLTDGFWLGKYEVTQGEWEALMGTTIRSQRDMTNGEWPLLGVGTNHPMYFVSWNDAMEFCQELTSRERAEDRLPAGYEYTLPSEAQWEYACRAGTTGSLNSGQSLTSTTGRCRNLDELGWYEENSGGKTHPVGGKRANAWGLYDMHGNVWEWTRSWYGDYLGGTVRDHEGPRTGVFRVYRGGSWYDDAQGCRSAARNGNLPGGASNHLGFRVALAPSSASR